MIKKGVRKKSKKQSKNNSHQPHHDKSTYAHKAHMGISYFLRITIIIAFIGAIFQQDWITVFLSAFVFTLTFLPWIIERSYKVDIPIRFEIVIVLFLYASIFLGEVQSYYKKFWWWDIILHNVSGIVIALIGFIVIYVLDHVNKIKLSLTPKFTALFAFNLAMSIGVLWEIFEFSMDYFFSLNMQSTGLTDTMWDLIVDALGALIVSLWGYFYMKKSKGLFLSNYLQEFLLPNKKNSCK